MHGREPSRVYASAVCGSGIATVLVAGLDLPCPIHGPSSALLKYWGCIIVADGERCVAGPQSRCHPKLTGIIVFVQDLIDENGLVWWKKVECQWGLMDTDVVGIGVVLSICSTANPSPPATAADVVISRILWVILLLTSNNVLAVLTNIITPASFQSSRRRASQEGSKTRSQSRGPWWVLNDHQGLLDAVGITEGILGTACAWIGTAGPPTAGSSASSGSVPSACASFAAAPAGRSSTATTRP